MTDMQTSTKTRIGIGAGFSVAGTVVFTPKTVPHWLWEIEGVALTVLLMAIAATGAVLWERYGPNGYKVRGAEFEEWRAQFNAARADFDAAVTDFKAAVNGQETRIKVLDGGDR